MKVALPRITILIVDDQRVTRYSLKTVLEQFGDMHVVGEAANGEEAIVEAKALSPDIIFMDIGMPGMGGIEAVKRIKANVPDQRVVIYTTSVADNDIIAALSAGADGYCLKESLPAQIAQIIRTVNEGIACLDPSIAKKILALSIGTNKPAPLSTDKDAAHSHFGLSESDLKILKEIQLGHTSQDIANHLLISLETLKTRMNYLLVELGKATPLSKTEPPST